MTREEAIELLKRHNLYSPTKQIEEAMDMAIEALQTENKPCKVIAEVKVDIDEIVEHIKEKYVFTNEVVRCKDCRHRDLFSCPLADNDFQKDDDYCSWGERREE